MTNPTRTAREVGEAKILTHDQAVQRIVDNWEMFETIRCP